MNIVLGIAGLCYAASLIDGMGWMNDKNNGNGAIVLSLIGSVALALAF